jgi:4-methyl-5(b-hydroxyethyl)-thiazole monophosphate biosynthesis
MCNPATALVLLIDGFEEIEAIAAIDILRRAQIEVIVAGVERALVNGSHKVAVAADRLLAEVAGREFDLVVLPGGPGTPNLARNAAVRDVVRRHAERGKWIGAICAAPSVLAELGLLEGRRAVCHPTAESKMTGAKLSHDPVALDGNFITSRGAGTAVAFGLALVKHVLGAEEAARIARAICAPAAAAAGGAEEAPSA